VYLKTTVNINGDPETLWAIGYNEPGLKHDGSMMIKKQVFTFGSSVTKDGLPSTISKKRICVNEETGVIEDVVKIVPCPAPLLEYYSGAAGIDVQNHLMYAPGSPRVGRFLMSEVPLYPVLSVFL